jgi:hypothetical protein
LYSPFIQCLEWIWDLAQSLELDMRLSGDFTFLPIWFDILKFIRLELSEGPPLLDCGVCRRHHGGAVSRLSSQAHPLYKKLAAHGTLVTAIKGLDR